MLGFADLFGGPPPPPPPPQAQTTTAAAAATAAAASPAAGSVSRASMFGSAPLLALFLVALVWAYLWFAAGSDVGTLSRPAWYAAAVAQGWLALLALRAEAAVAGSGTRKRFAMSGAGSLLAVLLGAPLLHATLYELLLHDADRGSLYTQPTAWVGRAVAAAGVLAAGALLVRRVRAGRPG